MKKCKRLIIAMLLLVMCIVTMIPTAYASEKDGESRAIAIVFDNSGSMYDSGDQAWCRATYAMEVFASMLNENDTLQIYPMHPITVGGKQYTMDNPFELTDASQASVIRDIYTEKASGTPIESVDAAAMGLQSAKADKKYLIVLTDGDIFYMNGSAMSSKATKTQLDTRFGEYTAKGIKVMYLGIGGKVVMPSMEENESFIKKQAKDSKDVLSSLTDMCNQIFGRDTLPETHLSGSEVSLDISVSKLIVFVQGENVSNLNLTGTTGTVGTKLSSAATKYGTAGCGNHKSVPDTSLQGMMVTYADCSSGNYTINFSGEASSIEVYYEPDADLDFVFTHINGNAIDPSALYEGEYKISFGMKDAKTGELISSDLLGNTSYQGSYFINGTEYPISCTESSGEIPVTLNVGDTFDAKLTVTYLSGYTITKEAADFGWPEGGLNVAARPAGELTLVIEGGDAMYPLQDLPGGNPYIATVFYQGQQLTGSELEQVELKWDPDTSNAEIMQNFADDHYDLTLDYKETIAKEETPCGECTVTIYAFYTEKGSSEAQAQTTLTYNIEDTFLPLDLDLYVPQDYIVIAELDKSEPITAALTMNGEKLSPKDFAATELIVDSMGIQYEVIPNEQDSSYQIKLLPTDGIGEDKYKISVIAKYTDNIGRTTEAEDDTNVTLSGIPLWMKWLFFLIILIILIIIISIILHIKVLPKRVKVRKQDSSMTVDDEPVLANTNLTANMKKGAMEVFARYAGVTTGLSMNIKPGKDSHLKRPSAKRYAEVSPTSVRKKGQAKITDVMIGSVKYALDEESGKLVSTTPNQKPFPVKHGTRVQLSGVMNVAGGEKPFTMVTKLNFKKK